MNKTEAIKAMLEGKKVRKTTWHNYDFDYFDYIYYDENKEVFRSNKGNLVDVNYFSVDEWEEYPDCDNFYEELKQLFNKYKIDIYIEISTYFQEVAIQIVDKQQDNTHIFKFPKDYLDTNNKTEFSINFLDLIKKMQKLNLYKEDKNEV